MRLQEHHVGKNSLHVQGLNLWVHTTEFAVSNASPIDGGTRVYVLGHGATVSLLEETVLLCWTCV